MHPLSRARFGGVVVDAIAQDGHDVGPPLRTAVAPFAQIARSTYEVRREGQRSGLTRMPRSASETGRSDEVASWPGRGAHAIRAPRRGGADRARREAARCGPERLTAPIGAPIALSNDIHPGHHRSGPPAAPSWSQHPQDLHGGRRWCRKSPSPGDQWNRRCVHPSVSFVVQWIRQNRRTGPVYSYHHTRVEAAPMTTIRQSRYEAPQGHRMNCR